MEKGKIKGIQLGSNDTWISYSVSSWDKMSNVSDYTCKL